MALFPETRPTSFGEFSEGLLGNPLFMMGVGLLANRGAPNPMQGLLAGAQAWGQINEAQQRQQERVQQREAAEAEAARRQEIAQLAAAEPRQAQLLAYQYGMDPEGLLPPEGKGPIVVGNTLVDRETYQPLYTDPRRGPETVVNITQEAEKAGSKKRAESREEFMHRYETNFPSYQQGVRDIARLKELVPLVEPGQFGRARAAINKFFGRDVADREEFIALTKNIVLDQAIRLPGVISDKDLEMLIQSTGNEFLDRAANLNLFNRIENRLRSEEVTYGRFKEAGMLGEITLPTLFPTPTNNGGAMLGAGDGSSPTADPNVNIVPPGGAAGTPPARTISRRGATISGGNVSPEDRDAFLTSIGAL